MKKIFLPVLLIVGTTLNAQNHYRFEESTAPYSNLTGATVIQKPDFSSGEFHNLDLTGETFKFYDVPFPFGGIKTIALQTNGNARIDNDSSAIIIDGAFGFLDSIDNNSELSHKVEGAAGNKVAKMQWKHLKFRAGPDSNYLNLQIWLYQKTGVIEIHYGPSYKNASGYSATNGPQVGMFYSDDGFTAIYEKLWITNTPANIVIDSAKKFAFKTLSGVPSDGTVYRFVPRFGTVSARAVSKNSVLPIYPNPATHSLQLPALRSGFVTDASGRKVLEFDNTDQLNLLPLQNGLYILHTYNGEVARFVKE